MRGTHEPVIRLSSGEVAGGMCTLTSHGIQYEHSRPRAWNASVSIVTRSSRCQSGTPAPRVIMDAASVVAVEGEGASDESRSAFLDLCGS
jgi:hypothetical protein